MIHWLMDSLFNDSSLLHNLMQPLARIAQLHLRYLRLVSILVLNLKSILLRHVLKAVLELEQFKLEVLIAWIEVVVHVPTLVRGIGHYSCLLLPSICMQLVTLHI